MDKRQLTPAQKSTRWAIASIVLALLAIVIAGINLAYQLSR